MDAELRGRQQDRPADRHDWNSYENYVQVFEARVESHPFVDRGRPHTIAFEFYEFEGDLLLEMAGQIYCRKNVVLEGETSSPSFLRYSMSWRGCCRTPEIPDRFHQRGADPWVGLFGSRDPSLRRSGCLSVPVSP